MTKKVFISRNEDDTAALRKTLAEDGFDTIAISMIRTGQIIFDRSIPQTDWIFFSSSNAVRHFFNGQPILGNQKFAAIGEGTARVLSEYKIPDFTGNSIDIEMTARDFASKIPGKSVLFPCSAQSLMSIQRAFEISLVFNLICYSTTSSPVNIGFPEILVFSSPSNVRSFFQMNQIRDHQKIIAFGPSTSKALKEHGVANPILPESLSDEGLFNAIKAI